MDDDFSDMIKAIDKLKEANKPTFFEELKILDKILEETNKPIDEENTNIKE